MKGLALLCAGLFFCLPARAQNLVMNPGMQDLNMCCDFGFIDSTGLCSPAAWFTLNGGRSVRVSDKINRGITINPIKYAYDVAPDYTIVALVQSLKQGCTYKGTFVMPGNKKIMLFYSFIDSLQVNKSPAVNDSLINSLTFDSVPIKGNVQSFTITGRPGKYIIFKLVSPTKTLTNSYSQRIESFEITPVNCKHDLNNEETREWIKSVYREQRRHDFTVPCVNDNTIRK